MTRGSVVAIGELFHAVWGVRGVGVGRAHPVTYCGMGAAYELVALTDLVTCVRCIALRMCDLAGRGRAAESGYLDTMPHTRRRRFT